LAIHFLHAAIEPTKSPTSSQITLKWDDLLAKDSLYIGSMQRKEEGIEYPDTVPPDPETWVGRIKSFVALSVFLIGALFFVVSAMAGCNTVLRWFTSPTLP